jgi:phytoene desaturase
MFKVSELINILQLPIANTGPPVKLNSRLNYALNYSLISKGLYYPVEGIAGLVNYFTDLLAKLNVPIHTSSPVDSYDIIDNKVTGIITHGKNFHADYFVAATDYHMTEQQLPKEFRNYTDKDWETRKDVHSYFVYFLGINKELESLKANTLIFNTSPEVIQKMGLKYNHDLDVPLAFVTCPAKLSPGMAPKGSESLIVRTIIPPGIDDTGKHREHYLERIIELLEEVTGIKIAKHVVYKKSFAQTDFESEFGTYQGETFGWLNSQQARFGKHMKVENMHLHNLFYAENQMDLGVGISSSLITGEIVTKKILESL